jgi:pyridoxamine 5'-phosphate oxidase
MNKTANLASLRKDYRQQTLLESDVDRDPLQQFQIWFQQALDSEIAEPNAMTLATASLQGKPSARIVLLKGIQDNGFVFFTNYDSKKGRQIHDNPFGCLVFFWKELERQVRIEGVLEKISAADSDAYFSTRPYDSQVGAWSSPQSKVIENRAVLEKNVSDYTAKFQPDHIKRPDHWGGYVLKPTLVEFWQGRAGRLHDRLQYRKDKPGTWLLERLAP